MNKIVLDKTKPYADIIGESEDGARFQQGVYRFKPDGKVIGDEVKLLAEAQNAKIKESEERLAQAKKEMAELEASQSALIQSAEAEVAALSGTTTSPTKAEIFIYQGRPYNEKELKESEPALLEAMVTEKGGEYTTPDAAVDLLLSA
jgi:hypothetical protein